MGLTGTSQAKGEASALTVHAALVTLLKKYKLRSSQVIVRSRYLVCKVRSAKFGRGFLKMSKQRGTNLFLRNQIVFDRKAGQLLRASGSQVQLPRVFSSGSQYGYRYLISQDVGNSLLCRDPGQSKHLTKRMPSADCLLLAIAHREVLLLPAIPLPLDTTSKIARKENRLWVDSLIQVLKAEKGFIKRNLLKIIPVARQGRRNVTLFPRYGDLLPWHVHRGQNEKLYLTDSEMACSISIKWADVAWCAAALSINGGQLGAAEEFVGLLRGLLPARLRASFDRTARYAFAQRCLYGFFEACVANSSRQRQKAAEAFATAVIAGRFCRF